MEGSAASEVKPREKGSSCALNLTSTSELPDPWSCSGNTESSSSSHSPVPSSSSSPTGPIDVPCMLCSMAARHDSDHFICSDSSSLQLGSASLPCSSRRLSSAPSMSARCSEVPVTSSAPTTAPSPSWSLRLWFQLAGSQKSRTPEGLAPVSSHPSGGDGVESRRSIERQRRATHACFFTPLPPNLGLSAQLWHSPQSPRLHGRHLPQRRSRGPAFLSFFSAAPPLDVACERSALCGAPASSGRPPSAG
mmetsp:Transcript_37455/g.93150  ORF Transcript_37455/g.93150 Transcript_37455/m.93150 type:complete len:249 (-) Transcript_37455:523-1269(-)